MSKMEIVLIIAAIMIGTLPLILHMHDELFHPYLRHPEFDADLDEERIANGTLRDLTLCVLSERTKQNDI